MTRPLLLALFLLAAPVVTAEPDYAAWDALLARYYDPQRGMNYAALKQHDAAALRALRSRLGSVQVETLDRNQQLAYWINLYNVNALAIVIERYPVRSIRDLSSDPIRRLNVFERPLVPFRGGRISLDHIEHKRLRDGFRDPRIHFAINCAARSCPPMPARALRGLTVQAALDEQTRAFLSRARIERRDGRTILYTTRIMEWFADDFENWGGGALNFIRRYLPPGKKKQLTGAVRIVYEDYDWSLNDWR